MKQFILIIEGPMGSGKTTIGNILHKKLPRTALFSTAHIKNFVSDFESTPEDNGMTAAVMYAICEEYVKHGINIILPQAFWKKEFIDPYVKLAEENSLQFLMYQLEAPLEILRKRIINRPKEVSESKMEQNLEKWMENRYDLGKIIDTSSMTAEKAAEVILEDIESL